MTLASRKPCKKHLIANIGNCIHTTDKISDTRTNKNHQQADKKEKKTIKTNSTQNVKDATLAFAFH